MKIVVAPIDVLSLEGGSPTDGDVPEVADGGAGWKERHLVFKESVPSSLECVAGGGYPPPDITIQLGGDDITNRLSLSHVVRLLGNRSLRSETEIRSAAIRVGNDVTGKSTGAKSRRLWCNRHRRLDRLDTSSRGAVYVALFPSAFVY